MFAKSGIIVTTVAAGLVALSPLAYAACNHDHHGSSHKDHGPHHYVDADYHHGGHGGNGGWGGNGGGHGSWAGNGGGSNNGGGDKSCQQQTSSVGTGGHGGGLINLSGNSIQVPVQACNNNILSNLGLGILGNGSARSH